MKREKFPLWPRRESKLGVGGGRSGGPRKGSWWPRARFVCSHHFICGRDREMRRSSAWLAFLVLAVGRTAAMPAAPPPRMGKSANFVELLREMNQTNDSDAAVQEADQALNFLQTFGYLEQSNLKVANFYSGDAVVNAIKQMQKFGAIPETGRLDNATVKLMHTKRCGVEDVTRKSDPDSLQLRSLTGHQQNSRRRTKRFIQGAEGWRKRTITYFISNWSPKLSEQVVVSEMQKAFQVWAEYANLKFVRVNSPDADIIVAFGRGPHGDGYAFDGEGLVLAHAFYPYEFGSFGGDIHFDDDEKWKLKLDGPFDDGVDFFSVAVHELGHSLGLAHSPEKDSVMFPYFKGFNNNPARLAYDDVLGMYHVYVSKNLPETDKTEAPDRQSPRPTTTTARPTTTRPTTRRLPGYPSYPTRRPYTTTTTMRTTQRPSFVPTYEGDYDTVTSHRQKFGSSTPIGGRMTVQSTEKTSSSSTTHRTATEVVAHDDDDDHRQRPNKNNHTICDGAVDTIALLRGEIVVIRDSLVWRLSDKGVTLAGYPVPFRRLFWQLPDEVTKIDAIYERPGDNTIVIFSGDKYWETDGNRLSPNSPRSLTFLGLPSFVKKVDAVLVWGKNGKTYFFSDKYYWKMDDSLFMMEQGYPQKITERWRGVPSNIDAALTYRDGMTYFFKGKQYWRFDNAEIQTLQKYPKSSGRDWFGCS